MLMIFLVTPEDIAEVVVFAAGRRENVVLADSLIFPNHQVSGTDGVYEGGRLLTDYRRLPRSCIGRLPVSERQTSLWDRMRR
jgi:hypothetical protein